MHKFKYIKKLHNRFKVMIRPYWNMQTPYGALFYQTTTSRNCKPFRTQFFSLLLTIDKTQTFKACKTSVLPMDTHLKLHATYFKKMTQIQTHPLNYLNAHLESLIN